MGWLLISATSLVCNDCLDLNLMNKCLSFARFGHPRNVDSFSALKSLAITSSKCWLPMLSLRGESDVPDLLPNLEELSLVDIHSLRSVSELVDCLGLKLSMLKMILVSRCPHMTCIFNCETFSQTLNLETIKVRSCKKLTMLFSNGIILPNLRILELRDLKRLRTLCTGLLVWPRLEKLHVFQCHGLFQLAHALKEAGNIKEIIGERQWWRLTCIYGYTREPLQWINVLFDVGTREQEMWSQVYDRSALKILKPFFKEVVLRYSYLFPQDLCKEAVQVDPCLFALDLFQKVAQECASKFPEDYLKEALEDYASLFPQDLCKEAIQVDPCLFAADLFKKAVQDYTSQFPQNLFKEAVQDYASLVPLELNFDDEYSFIRRCYTPGSP